MIAGVVGVVGVEGRVKRGAELIAICQTLSEVYSAYNEQTKANRRRDSRQ